MVTLQTLLEGGRIEIKLGLMLSEKGLVSSHHSRQTDQVVHDP